MDHAKEQLDQPCTEKILAKIAQHIIKYQQYGFELDLTRAEIEAIEGAPATFGSITARTTAVFHKWRSKKNLKGETATYRSLLKVALELQDESGAVKICEICAQG